MRKILFSAICAAMMIGAANASAQGTVSAIKSVKPSQVETRDFAAENAKFTADLKKFNELVKQNKEVPDELQYFFDCGGQDDPYTSVPGDCDGWYVCGGPDEITASSSLAPQGKYTYKAQCAHDASMATPWCEGVEGNGIGEWLCYKMTPPRVTTVYIANGFVLNGATFANNARAKKIRLDYNGKPHCILELEDICGVQTFEVGELGDGVNPYELKFTVLQAYDGAKYKDLCISEIWFSGLDCLCFAKGTQVTMASGSKKPIEEVRKGDEILCFAGQSVSTAKVEEVAKAQHSQYVEYTLENGIKATCTPDHPIMCASKGWVSMDPAKTAASYRGYASCKKAEPGDVIVTSAGHSPVVSIRQVSSPMESYTIVKAGAAQNFLANGIVAGIEQNK